LHVVVLGAGSECTVSGKPPHLPGRGSQMSRTDKGNHEKEVVVHLEGQMWGSKEALG
jgi:hypothetical protein